YALDPFRPAFANRLHAIYRDAVAQVVRLDWCGACAGTDGQTDGGNLAFRDVIARLLAVAPISEIRSQTSEVSTPWSSGRKNPVVCSFGGVRGDHIPRAISRMRRDDSCSGLFSARTMCTSRRYYRLWSVLLV